MTDLPEPIEVVYLDNGNRIFRDTDAVLFEVTQTVNQLLAYLREKESDK